ncbi:MAG: serine/threonine-protein kinase [Nannocystaceae bacterium]|nr:serine/threonine protein kinase [bacterium]
MSSSRRSGKRLGKYKVLRRIADGGFGTVYKARDTIEGVDVALKVSNVEDLNASVLSDFSREAKVAATLEHPNILPLKNADVLEGTFVLVYRLGDESLASRMRRRYTVDRALDWSEQLLQGLSHAHENDVIHCDIKPDNIILFPGNKLRLGDFGLAKVKAKTRSVTVSGSGTIGYMAPEQALGRPSPRSDVFAAGITVFRLLSGKLPRWPFDWPLPGLPRVQDKAPEFVTLLRRALKVDARQRFEDASGMLAAFQSARARYTRRKQREAGS